MASTKVYIGLGANLGDPAENIREAIEMIESMGLGKVAKVSSLYRTEPVGIKDQQWFVNAAAMVETETAPELFRAKLAEIELKMGRPQKRIKDGPRLIDLDILMWGDEVIDKKDLKIPHPRMQRRRFVLQPLSEIAPHALHPKLKKTVRELLMGLSDPAVVEKIE